MDKLKSSQVEGPEALPADEWDAEIVRRLQSEGLRRDEAMYASDAIQKLARALKKRGVSDSLLVEAMRDAAA